MIVKMIGGPKGGTDFVVRDNAHHLRVDGFKVPIRYSPTADMYIARWSEREAS